jgi:tripartite-type tricarboxylate transporter receptor subunit TctC
MMRHISILLALALVMLVAPQFCAAAGIAYPDRPIRLIVGSSAGGGGDTTARIIADCLSKRLSVAVIVENRPGASGNIGANAVAKARPDGYTLLFAYTGHVINPGLFKEMPFDTVRDFRAVGKIGDNQSVLLIHPSVPAHTLREFVDLAKRAPGKYSFAALMGTDQYMTARLLAQKEDVNFIFVPYKGNAAAMTDILSGQVNAMINSVGVASPYVQAGNVRALAVLNRTRSKLLPDIPTLFEQGLDGLSSGGWYALMAPSATPDDVIQKLAGALRNSLNDEGVSTRLEALGVTPNYVGPPEFDQFIANEIFHWKKFTSDMDLAPE